MALKWTSFEDVERQMQAYLLENHSKDRVERDAAEAIANIVKPRWKGKEQFLAYAAVLLDRAARSMQ